MEKAEPTPLSLLLTYHDIHPLILTSLTSDACELTSHSQSWAGHALTILEKKQKCIKRLSLNGF